MVKRSLRLPHFWPLIQNGFHIVQSARFQDVFRESGELPVKTFPRKQMISMTLSIQVYHSTVREGQRSGRITEPGGYNHAAHIQFPVLFSENEKMKKTSNKHHWKTLPGQLGHELKYYLNHFHFLKNTGHLETFWLQEEISCITPEMLPATSGISDGNFKKC